MTKDEFLKIVTPVAELVGKKSQDYGTKIQEVQGWIVRLEEYFPFEHRSYVQMIWTKSLRLLNLTNQHYQVTDRGGKQPARPNFESIDDTVDDMIAYLVFYRKYLQDRKSRQTPFVSQTFQEPNK